MATYGAMRTASARSACPRCHHTANNNARGNTAVAALLRMAADPHTNASSIPEAHQVAAVPAKHPSFLLVEFQEQQHRQEEEESGLDVLQLGDPGHGFDVDRVEGPDHRGQPCRGYSQLAQEEIDHHRVGGMKQDVHQVIRQRMQSPELALDPEGCQGQWIISADGQRCPNHRQAMAGGHDRVGGQETVVVPDEAGVPCRLVRHDRSDHQNQRQEPRAGSEVRLRRRGRRWRRLARGVIDGRRSCHRADHNMSVYLLACYGPIAQVEFW